MVEAINETGTVADSLVEDNGERCRPAEQELCKEIMEVLEYLPDVHRSPPGWTGEGVIRVIYEILTVCSLCCQEQ